MSGKGETISETVSHFIPTNSPLSVNLIVSSSSVNGKRGQKI
ncbi:MAG: hypothetical protein WDA35_04550 [Bacilli bacterium]